MIRKTLVGIFFAAMPAVFIGLPLLAAFGRDVAVTVGGTLFLFGLDVLFRPTHR